METGIPVFWLCHVMLCWLNVFLNTFSIMHTQRLYFYIIYMDLGKERLWKYYFKPISLYTFNSFSFNLQIIRQCSKDLVPCSVKWTWIYMGHEWKGSEEWDASELAWLSKRTVSYLTSASTNNTLAE